MTALGSDVIFSRLISIARLFSSAFVYRAVILSTGFYNSSRTRQQTGLTFLWDIRMCRGMFKFQVRIPCSTF